MYLLRLMWLIGISLLQDGIMPEINIRNGSFESGNAGCCQVPPEWQNCGASAETPPDIHCSFCPNPFGVTMPAPHGEQFLALVVRSNGSKECLQQELTRPLPADSTYYLRLSLGRSDRYESIDRITGEPASFREVGTLVVYIMSPTGFVKQAGTIVPFRNYGWTEYYLRIRSDKEIAAIVLEAGYLPERSPYNGHILVDYVRLEAIPGP